MADHIGGKSLCGLLVYIIHGNFVKLMYPFGRVLTRSHLECSRSLHILPVEVKMSKHLSAVACRQKTVPDKTCQLLVDLILV